MIERKAALPPRHPRRTPALRESVLTVAAVAVISAALLWTVLFYNATRAHDRAIAAAAPAGLQADAPSSEQPTAVTPITTRTS